MQFRHHLNPFHMILPVRGTRLIGMFGVNSAYLRQTNKPYAHRFHESFTYGNKVFLLYIREKRNFRIKETKIEEDPEMVFVFPKV